MTPERFAYLADAYGADLRRWPDAEQAPAQALLRSGNVHARETLQQARWLDSQLDSYQPLVADAALVRQIRRSAVGGESFWSRYAGWLSPMHGPATRSSTASGMPTALWTNWTPPTPPGTSSNPSCGACSAALSILRGRQH